MNKENTKFDIYVNLYESISIKEEKYKQENIAMSPEIKELMERVNEMLGFRIDISIKNILLQAKGQLLMACKYGNSPFLNLADKKFTEALNALNALK